MTSRGRISDCTTTSIRSRDSSVRRAAQCLFVAACCLVTVPAWPQSSSTGTLTGKVRTKDGLALHGASVTAQSPSLQGKRTTLTSPSGEYTLPLLPPGVYTITFELWGFETLRQTVRVTAAEWASLSPTLQVAVVKEEITINDRVDVEFSPISAPIASTYDTGLMEQLPTARTLNAAVLLAPGVHGTGPNGLGGSPVLTINGAYSYENLFLVDGAVVNENIRGQPLPLYVEEGIQETTTQTGAVSAESGRFTGGVSNTITKSGGNSLSGSFRTTFDKDAWRALTPLETAPGGSGDTRQKTLLPTFEATLGGPFLRDRLWFFSSLRARDLKDTRTTASFTNIPYPHELDDKRFQGKLSLAVTSNHVLSGNYIHVASSEVGNSFGTILDLASLVNRSTPEDFYNVHYGGVLSSTAYVEAQFSRRAFAFQHDGATTTDLIGGTLLLDRQRGNASYHSPTFCGVCTDERRENWSITAKGHYFWTTKAIGSHALVTGVDVFRDQRFANNHQSGSDFRIYGTTTTIRGGQIYPVFNNDGTTFIRWSPIVVPTTGNDFRTYSGFLNDTWRLARVAFNLGVRYDKNDGRDSSGTTVVRTGVLSPRLSIVLDPGGAGKFSVTASGAKYVMGIANTLGDFQSAGGQPATVEYNYLGPPINVSSPPNPIGQDAALRTVFDWFFATGGFNRPFRGGSNIPGVNHFINATLTAPSVKEWTLGISGKWGNRLRFRVDGVYRAYQDFYGVRTDLSTGQGTAADPLFHGVAFFDRDVLENTNDTKKTHEAILAQINWRPVEALTFAGNYTLSETRGNFDGELFSSGPTTSEPHYYPEYRLDSWNTPVGDLSIDQRHKVRIWAICAPRLPSSVGVLTVSVLEGYSSGTPYGAVSPIDTRPYVRNPGYGGVDSSFPYYFTGRDAFHTQDFTQTDVALNYAHRLGLKSAEVFFRGTITNALGGQRLVDSNFIDRSVRTNNNSSSLQPFNPFTVQPVKGVHWDLGPTFGQAINRFAYQTPRTYSFSAGFRF